MEKSTFDWHPTQKIEFDEELHVQERSIMDEKLEEKPWYAKNGEFVTKHGVVRRAIFVPTNNGYTRTWSKKEN